MRRKGRKERRKKRKKRVSLKQSNKERANTDGLAFCFWVLFKAKAGKGRQERRKTSR